MRLEAIVNETAEQRFFNDQYEINYGHFVLLALKPFKGNDDERV